jgi:hypothetical protein
MEWVSGDIIKLLTFLMPGFLTAWILFGLTAYQKPPPFERVVQALIFTCINQVVTSGVEWLLLKAGTYRSFGVWNDGVQGSWLLADAIFLGLIFAWLANRDTLHWLLRACGLTANTSYPSEWFSAFKRNRRDVILHLKDERRRLHGWPEEWSNHSDSGHMLLCNVEWLSEDNTIIPLAETDCMLIPATEIEKVEFMKTGEEMEAKHDTET